MNKLNPFYILILLTVLMLISFNLNAIKSEELINSNRQINLFKKDVLEFNNLKSRVSSKKEVVKELNLISNDDEFIKANVTSRIENNKAMVKIVTSQRKTMQRFLNRFLNKNMKITKMEATKNYIVVEVKL